MQMQMVLKEQQQQARQKRQRYQTFGKGKVVKLRASPRSQQRRSQRQHQPLQQQSPQIQTALPKWLYTDENPGFAAQLSNVLINEAFLVAVLALTAYAVFTVDSEAWRGWYPNEILYRVPIDNWRSYETAVVADPVPIKAAITGVTYLIGDWLAQANSLSKEGKSWLMRTAHAFFVRQSSAYFSSARSRTFTTTSLARWTRGQSSERLRSTRRHTSPFTIRCTTFL